MSFGECGVERAVDFGLRSLEHFLNGKTYLKKMI